MKKKYVSQTGFTLIEVLLYVGIFSILLISTSVFVATLLESRIKNQTIAEVEQQGLQVMQIITQTVRNATSINTPSQGASGTFLSVDTYSGVLNPTVFDLLGGTIRITEGIGSAIVLANSRVSASALTFRNLSRASTPSIIRIQFTLSYVNNLGRNEYNYSKTFVGSASLRQP